MHHKYMLIASNLNVNEFNINKLLDDHRSGLQPNDVSTSFDISEAGKLWNETVAPALYIEGKAYLYESAPSHITDMSEGYPKPKQVTFTSIQRDSYNGNPYDRFTLYDAEGNICYPIHLPMSKLFDFKEFVKYAYDIDIYTSDELATMTARPNFFIRHLGGGKYRTTGTAPYIPYFRGYHIMTPEEIQDELSLDYNTARLNDNGGKWANTPAKGFTREDFSAWGYYHNTIDAHSHAVITSLGYDVDISRWQTFICRIMDQHEELLSELEQPTYRKEFHADYLDLLPRYPDLEEWIKRLRERGYPVFKYGDYIQLLPFVHLTDTRGEYNNPFIDVEYSLPFRCTSFVYLKDIGANFTADSLTDRTHPNILNRLAIYKEYKPARFFYILRYY